MRPSRAVFDLNNRKSGVIGTCGFLRNEVVTPQNEVILRNEAVQQVNTAKFLGVIVDQYLNFKDHFQWYLKKIPSHGA